MNSTQTLSQSEKLKLVKFLVTNKLLNDATKYSTIGYKLNNRGLKLSQYQLKKIKSNKLSEMRI